MAASDSENPDLFWGLRGGGGNFAIATRFTFEAQPVGPDLLSGLIVHPVAQARQVLEFYREFAAGAPDELTTWVVLRKAPPLPFLPEAVHGREVVALALAYAGDPAAGERAIAPLRQFGSPHGAHIGVQPFAAWQQAFDPLLTPGARNYWKSHNFATLADGHRAVLHRAVPRSRPRIPSRKHRSPGTRYNESAGPWAALYGQRKPDRATGGAPWNSC